MNKLFSMFAGLAIVAIFAFSALFADVGSSPPVSTVSAAATIHKHGASVQTNEIVPAAAESNRLPDESQTNTYARRAGKSDYYFQTKENNPGKFKEAIRNRSAINPPERILKNPPLKIPIYFDRRLSISPRDAPFI